MIKSFLIHLSMNMWHDFFPEWLRNLDPESYRERYPYAWQRIPHYMRSIAWSDHLQCNDEVWRKTTEYLAACGGNMLVIDVGDGVKFRSHPEIAVAGAWSRRKLLDELKRCRDLGLEVIPKLNFSTSHDAWMRGYSRMVSSPPYYRFCRELIEETCELFESPRFFHIGMDEETMQNQTEEGYMYATVRRGELWWDDLNFYCNEVRRQQARPWMWADKLWDCTDEEFRHNVPLDVIQSNWYYSNHFELERTVPGAENFNRQTAAYLRLDRMGYDQIPAGSNWWCFENYRGTVEFCEKQLAPEHLLGFMTAPWYPTDETSLEILLEGCDQIKTGHC